MKKLSDEEQFELDSEIELNRSEQRLKLDYQENKYSFNMADVCGYLTRNPGIENLDIRYFALSDGDASLLAPILPTIKCLEFHYVKISEKGMPRLLAHNPAIKLVFTFCQITDQQASYLAGASLPGLSIVEHELHISGAGLDSLTNNKQLDTFCLKSRPIIQKAVLEVFENKLSLTHLSLDNPCDIGYRNGTLTSLNLNFNQIGDDGARLLKDHRTITNLSLNGNGITEQGAMALVSSDVITHLILTDNKIGDTGAAAFKSNSTITYLKLARCGISFWGAKDLACNKTITSLTLSFNNIGDQGAAAFKDQQSITNLMLGECGIGERGAIELADNKTITSLNLSKNIIGNEGAAAFKDNQSITDLNLSQCGIGAQGAIELAKNRVITCLDMYKNAIGDGGAAAFRDNTSLIRLELMSCHITYMGATVLANNKTIKDLNLWGNSIEDAGAAAFMDNSSLTRLDLSESGITETGVSALALNQSISRLFLYEDNFQQLWTPSAVYFLRANLSLLNGFCGTFQKDLNHLSLSDTSLLKKMGLRNRLFQEKYSTNTKKELFECLGINDLVNLVYDYAKGEFPFQYGLFKTHDERKAVNDLCKKMPELRKRFDFVQ